MQFPLRFKCSEICSRGSVWNWILALMDVVSRWEVHLGLECQPFKKGILGFLL